MPGSLLLYEEDVDDADEADEAEADALEEQAADASETGLAVAAEEEDPWQDVSQALFPEEVEAAFHPAASDAHAEPHEADAVDGLPAPADEAADDVRGAAAEPQAPVHRDPNASEEFVLAGLGCLRYYARRKTLVAVCTRPEHQDCRISRATNASEFTTRNLRGQGRPIGRLVSWLQQQGHADHPDSRRHIHARCASLQLRQEARAYFEGLPDGREFAERVERACRADEEAEPEFIR